MNILRAESKIRFKYLSQPQIQYPRVAGITTSAPKVGKSQSSRVPPSPQLQSVVRNQRQRAGKPPPSKLPPNYKKTARNSQSKSG
ncbi:MAG: hypothetical protein Q9171_007525 [Xanthocarpia ochracea]